MRMQVRKALWLTSAFNPGLLLRAAFVSQIKNTCIYDGKAMPQNRRPLNGSLIILGGSKYGRKSSFEICNFRGC